MGGHDKRKMLARVRHKERKRLAGKCQNKRRYEFAEAQLYAAQYQHKPYKCPLCHYWHLTRK